MSSFSSRVTLPALFTIAAWCQVAAAQVEPADLDTNKIQDRVGKYLASERGQLRARLLAPFIATPRGAELTYKKDATNQPESLVWKVRAVRPLSAQESRDVEQELRNILEASFGDALGEGKPFLTDANSKKLLAATKVSVDSARQDTAPSTGGLQLYQGWAQVCCCSPCGCGGYSYFVPVWYYGPAQAQSTAPTRQEREVRAPARAETQVRTHVLPQPAPRPAFVAKTPAEKAFARGLEHFQKGERGAALVWLWQAVETDADDARFWAFKALAERSLGDARAAQASARRAAALQVLRRGPGADEYARSLEDIQQSERAFLDAANDGKLTRSAAEELVNAPVSTTSATDTQRGGASVTRK